LPGETAARQSASEISLQGHRVVARLAILVAGVQPTDRGIVFLVEQVVAVQRDAEVAVDLVGQAGVPDGIAGLLDIAYPTGTAKVVL
jgi:hypothetical protein